ALLGLAGALARHELALHPSAGRGDTERTLLALPGSANRVDTERTLLALPGIGPWTVAYIAMRALGDADAFLPTDLGVRRGLEALGRDGRPFAAAALAEQWRPYRAYAVQHLWAVA
ncbi:MAG: DNA-3-methyladenine glycosylase 2 family protein, partial [Actinomycetota bacterium]|nr:DNA-3-methyladenine glycosylase 2 family protein [Actinomycetota bacterium]